MRTEYRYIYFTKVEDKPKTTVWHCLNRSNDAFLAEIKWYSPWRQYCFFPGATTVFNISCLEDIGSFIRQLAKEKK